MTYVLGVLTHGDNKLLLDNLIHSFSANVSPAPAACIVVQDGPCETPPFKSLNWTVVTLEEQLGFCSATNALWVASSELAETVGATHVFWLEHDFQFLRHVDIDDMAAVLGQCERLAQVSLMRHPVNPPERAAGGVIELARSRGLLFKQRDGWIEHSAYFTTNPSLMSSKFMMANPWPSYQSECEGRFGIDLLARGYNFAIMGDGSAWVKHVGIRTGKGY